MEPTDALHTDVQILCPECDYDLRGASGERCPWCGWRIDYEHLLSQVRAVPSAKRYGVAVTGFVVGAGALAALVSLTVRGTGSGLFDGFLVISVVTAAVGHLSLAALALVRRKHWPLRRGAASDLLVFAAWLSIILAVVGSVQFLTELPTRRVVRGVVVNGVAEFAAAAMLLVLPGVTLLILHVVSFRARNARATRPRTQPVGSSLPVRASFVVDATGRYHAGDRIPGEGLPVAALTHAWSSRPRPTTPAVENRISRTWEEQSRSAAAQDRPLYDGRLIRLVAATAGPSGLHLELGATTFREFLGTNLFNAAATLREPPAALANALGVSAIVLCSDHLLGLGRRSKRVAYHAGYLHTFGGLVEESDRRPDGTCDLFGAIARELQEEARIAPHELAELSAIGLIRDREILQPELVFEAVVRLSSRELWARFDPGLPDQEHTGFEFVFAEPDAFLPFLRRSAPVAPVAEAALLLYGRENFGPDWYEQTCYVLYGEMPPATGTVVSGPG